MKGWIWAACLLGSFALSKADDIDLDVDVDEITNPWTIFDEPPNNGNVSETVAEQEGNQLQEVTYGYGTRIGQFPYMVVVMIYYYGYYYHVCGGVILNQHTVLTSAHCLRYINYYNYYVAVGIRDLRLGLSNPGSQRIKVTSHLIHAQYDRYGAGYPNNIAVLHLHCRIKYNYYVKPAPLATKYDGKFSHSRCNILGWGFTEWGYPNILQTAYMYALSNYQCQLWWAISYRAKILGTHLCVYRYPISGCYGDSGGPIVCNGKVAGLLSWKGRRCTGCRPTVGTRISSYSKWIKMAGTLS